MSKMSTLTRCLAGLLTIALAACAIRPPPGPVTLRTAASDIDWDRVQPFKVTLSDFDFTPDRLTFRVGVPVRLVLVDDGSGKHDFSAPEFLAEAAYRAGSPLPEKGMVMLKENQTVELDLVPTVAGKYSLECTEFLHSIFGMTGTIDVVS